MAGALKVALLVGPVMLTEGRLLAITLTELEGVGVPVLAVGVVTELAIECVGHILHVEDSHRCLLIASIVEEQVAWRKRGGPAAPSPRIICAPRRGERAESLKPQMAPASPGVRRMRSPICRSRCIVSVGRRRASLNW